MRQIRQRERGNIPVSSTGLLLPILICFIVVVFLYLFMTLCIFLRFQSRIFADPEEETNRSKSWS